MQVHSHLGPGLLESVYRLALQHELRKRGLRVISEKPIAIHYDGIDLGTGLRLDLLVLSHLHLCRCKKGLLINFNVRHLRHGIRRFVR
jgi:hypothetical protein